MKLCTVLAVLLLTVSALAQPVDPGPRGGTPDAGGPLPSVSANNPFTIVNFFLNAEQRFQQGATNVIPSFILPSGAVREARFVYFTDASGNPITRCGVSASASTSCTTDGPATSSAPSPHISPPAPTPIRSC